MKFFCQYAGGSYTIKSPRYGMDNFGNRMFQPGIEVKFNESVFETKDEELIEQIRQLPEFGFEITSDQKEEVGLSAEEVKEHEAEAKSLVPEATGCPKCSYKATSETSLKAHIKAKHADEEDVA